VIVMGHSPDFLRSKLGFRVSRHVSRRVFAVSPAHPVTKGLTEADLRDWNGSSTVLPEYQQSPLELRDGKPSGPRWGWHRGNRGAVTSAAIEMPHLSGWRPLLECEFDLAYSPLMELDYGAGRVLLCTLDLEDHAAADPAADRLARQLFTYALRPLPAAREKRVAVVGDSSLLDLLKLRGQKTDALDPAADLNVLAPGARVDPAALTAYLEKGGKVLALARRGGAGLPGIGVREDPAFNGALQVPSWPEAAGLSPSDLRARAAFPAELVDTGVEVGAGGLLGRKVVGKGVLVTCQIDPDRLDADRNSYLRFTRWRYTRAVAQLLANLGGSFEADRNVFPGGAGLAPFYHPDYRSDFALGDDPYRYARP
jgi:beta-galactosidase